MSASGFSDLQPHVGHSVEVVAYSGHDGPPWGVAIECEECNVVLLDFDEGDEPPCGLDFMSGQICMLPKGHEGSHR